MQPSLRFGRRLLVILAVLALAGAAGACGGGGSVVDNFKGKITASDFQFEGALSGTFQMTVSGQTVDGTVSGTAKVKGKDSATTMTMAFMGQTQTQDSVTVGGTTYSRSGTGSWSSSAATDTDTFASTFNKIGDLEDKGVQSWKGSQLHKLTPKNPNVDPKTILGADSGFTDATVTVTFWAKDDGTPAGMTLGVAGNSTSGGTSYPMTMTIDFSMDKLSGVTVEKPAGA